MKQHQFRKLRTLTKFALAMALTTASVVSHAIPSVFPTGVTVYDPAAAYNNYVLFSGADGKTHLIDMDGNEVHRWEYSGFPSGIIDPALIDGQRGHVIVQLSKIDSPNTGTSVDPGKALLHGNKTVGELDWDGNKVWEWGEQAPDHAARQHHDWIRLANGNTLLLANQIRTIPGFKTKNSFDDVIYEVDPKGNIVWQWIASEHLKEFGFSPESLKLVKNTDNPDYLHLNNLKLVGPNKWFDAGDKRFAPDNLITDSRNANFIIIIDKKTGKVVWRLGPDYPNSHGFTFGKGGAQQLPRPVDQISGQHDAHIIPEGLPGAGNLLVFDNQGDAGYPPVERSVQSGSRILEIDPIKKEIVWEYSAVNSGQPSWIFFSPYISDARRLPNGNTLIDEGINGRFFQVTPAGKIVWEYVSPYKDKSGVSSSVYRLQPVPYDWVPAGTPHSENAVTPPANVDFHVPTAAH